MIQGTDQTQCPAMACAGVRVYDEQNGSIMAKERTTPSIIGMLRLTRKVIVVLLCIGIFSWGWRHAVLAVFSLKTKMSSCVTLKTSLNICEKRLEEKWRP
jgi:hypothetical protein